MRAYRKLDDRYEIRIDGGRLVLLGVGAGLVLLLVFLLGVLVGKGLWGGRRPAPVPLAEVPSAEVPAPAPPEERTPPEFTFYDDLKKPDAAPSDRPSREAPAAPKPEPAPAAPAAEPRATPEPEPGPARTEPPPAPKAKAPPPAPAPKAALPAPVFTVQVGSFRDRNAAQELARTVSRQGIPAQVIPATVSGRTWYRVQVGRFETRSDAEAHYRKNLKPRGIQGFVTAR